MHFRNVLYKKLMLTEIFSTKKWFMIMRNFRWESFWLLQMGSAIDVFQKTIARDITFSAEKHEENRKTQFEYPPKGDY